MPRTPDVIVPPKDYYIKQRTEGFSDWPFAFFRELFQNSVDAGARNIHITIGDVPGRGSFGRPARIGKAVRVSFTDDGTGMPQEVLRDVFFKPGRSTKTGGDTVGGFGTARVTLCFSQDGYRIHTGGCLVEGDGAEYDIMTVDEAAGAKREQIAEAELQAGAGRTAARIAEVEALLASRVTAAREAGNGAQADALGAQHDIELATLRAGEEEAARRIAQMRAELAEIESIRAPRKGARFDIDIDPQEGSDRYRWVSQARLRAALDDYLSLSQVPCKVFLDGQEVTTKALRGAKRRELVATMGDGSKRAFAAVHISGSERARHKGKVIVRVDGACMFTENTVASSQVIVELDPAQAREVLTETRDSFKAPFDRALSGFRSELELDVKSALEEKEKRKHTVIRGGRGSMKAKLDVSGLSYAPKATAVTPGAPADVHVPLPKAALAVPEEVEFRGARPQPGEVLAEGVLDIAALPKAVLEHFVDAVTRGEPTFLSQWPARDEADEFARRARGGGEAFFAAVSPEFSAFVAANVADRMADAGIPLKQAAADLKYADLHDIHIYAEDIGDDERLKTAMRRWSPDFWAMQGDTRKVDIGRGMSSHRFLSAWTVSCEYALKALQGYAPALFAGKEIPWATGFYFARPEMRWTPVGYEKTRRAALHKEIDGVNVLLVNPLLESGKPAFDITRPKADARYSADGSEAVMGLQELEAMALHEACHVFRAFHDEEFSGLLTGALGLFDRAAARARMREADAAVQAAYGRGRTLVQAMDGAEAAALDPDGKAPAKARGDRKAEAPRPAGKLLAHAARTAAMAAGIALSPENAAFEAPAVREAFLGAVSTAGDGVVTVDCDRLQGLEAALSVGAANGWDEQISLAAFDGMGAQQDEETEAAAPLPATAGPSGSSAARGTAWRPEDTAGLDGLDEALAALRSAPQRSPAGRAAAPVSPGPLVVEGLDDALAALRSEQAALQPPHVAQRPAPLTAPPPPIADGDLPPVDRDEGLAAIADDLVGNEWGMDIFGEETSVQAPGM